MLNWLWMRRHFDRHVGEANRDVEELIGKFSVQDRNAEVQMVGVFIGNMENIRK